MGAIATEIVDRGEKRDVRGRRVFPREERGRLLELYHSSGMTVAEFARRESINYSTMAGWVARSSKATSVRPMRFAEVHLPVQRAEPSRPDDRLEIQLTDGTVLRGSNVKDVIAVLRALRS
jgi:transposase-like protein